MYKNEKKVAVRFDEDKLKIIDYYVEKLGKESRNRFIIDALDFYIDQYSLTQLKHLPPSIEIILSSNLNKLEQIVSSFLCVVKI